MTEAIPQQSVLDAIAHRRSVRAFLPKSVAKSVIDSILQTAARAPSGNNTQPWSVNVLTAAPLNSLTERLVAEAKKMRSGKEKASPYEYDYYPEKWCEPFLSRRRKIGFDLYASLNIKRDDVEGRQQQFEENYRFFGAPVGMFVFIDRRMGKGSFLDTGMFIENILLAARAYGLETCAQAAFSAYHSIIYQELQTPAEAMLVCGIALGYEDTTHPSGQLITERVAVNDFTSFAGF